MRWLLGVGALVVVAAAVTTAVVLSQDDEKLAACLTAPSSVAGATGAAPLRTTEIGFSQLGKTVSIGAVLENTSKQVVYRARLTFVVLDAEAKPVSTTNQLSLDVPVIVAGQRISVGTWGYVEGTVSKVAITYGQAQLVEPKAEIDAITANYVSMSRVSDPSSAGITYEATSRYCQALKPRGVMMVFRRGDGSIAGGSFELGAETCAPGTTSGRAMAATSVPTGIDESKTEIQPLCDFAAPGPKSSGGPAN